MKQHPDSDRPTICQIRVKGRLDENRSDWFSGLTVTFRGGVTTITGPAVDQPALRGVLSRILGLNLALLSVTRGDEL